MSENKIKIKFFYSDSYTDRVSFSSNLFEDDEVHLWQFSILPDPKKGSLESCSPLLEHYLTPGYQIVRNQHGKPIALDAKQDRRCPVQFNISHSRSRLVVAFFRGQSIGVDIEDYGTKKTWPNLAKRFYSSLENKYLQSLPVEYQEDHFYKLWTLKEAFIKGLGVSLFTGLNKANFILGSDSIALENPDPVDPEYHFFHFKQGHYLSLSLTK